VRHRYRDNLPFIVGGLVGGLWRDDRRETRACLASGTPSQPLIGTKSRRLADPRAAEVPRASSIIGGDQLILRAPIAADPNTDVRRLDHVRTSRSTLEALFRRPAFRSSLARSGTTTSIAGPRRTGQRSALVLFAVPTYDYNGAWMIPAQ